jgi:hypothetical protein
MRRLLAALALLIIPAISIGLAQPQPAAAVDVFQPCANAAKDTDVCQSVAGQKKGDNPIIDTLKIAITIIATIIGIAAVIVIIISGFSMVTSGGNSEDVAKARNHIIYALVGLIVAVLAETMVAFVLNKL